MPFSLAVDLVITLIQLIQKMLWKANILPLKKYKSTYIFSTLGHSVIVLTANKIVIIWGVSNVRTILVKWSPLGLTSVMITTVFFKTIMLVF